MHKYATCWICIRMQRDEDGTWLARQETVAVGADYYQEARATGADWPGAVVAA